MTMTLLLCAAWTGAVFAFMLGGRVLLALLSGANAFFALHRLMFQPSPEWW